MLTPTASMSGPPPFTRNPINCPKFVVNMFKAGSGKCRDCGHEWHQHEGVIDRQVADKFVQIWNHNQQKLTAAAAAAAVTSHKTEEELREEERRAYIAAQKKLNGAAPSKDWLSGGDGSGSNRNRTVSDDSSEEDFKYYSKEALSRLPTGASSSPVERPAKVVNLIDFSMEKPPSPRVGGLSGSASPALGGMSGSASPRLGGLSGSASPRLIGGGMSPHNLPVHPGMGSTTPGHLSLPLTAMHLRQSGAQSPRDENTLQGLKKLELIEQQVQVVTKELRDREHEIEVLRKRLAEQDREVELNKEESRRLTDQLQEAARSNTSKVEDLHAQLVLAEQKEKQAMEELAKRNENLEVLDRESIEMKKSVESLKLEIVELRSVVDTEKAKNAEIESQLERIQIEQCEKGSEDEKISALEAQLETARRESSALKQEIETVVSKLGERDTALESAEKRVHELESQGSVRDQKLTEMVKLSDMVNEQAAMICSLETELRAKTDQLGSRLRETLKMDGESDESILTYVMSRLSNEQSLVEMLEQKNSAQIQLENEVENLSSERASFVNQIEALTEQVRKENELRAQSESEMGKLQSDLETAKYHMDALVEEKAVIEQELAQLALKGEVESNLTQEVAKKDQELQKVTEEIEGLKKTVADKDELLEGLETELRGVREELVKTESEVKGVRAQLDSAETQLTSVQVRLEEETKIRAQLEESRGSLEAGSERINAEISQLRSTVASLQGELDDARAEKDRVIMESKNLTLRIVELESSNASSAGEIESLRDSVLTMENELKYVRSERNAESDMGRAEAVRLTTELEAVSAKLAEVQSELAREVEIGVSSQARILQFEHVVEELKGKLTSTQAELNDALRSRSTNDKVASQCEQYLKAIQDVSFVVKTVTDKFLSPNASEVNSRAVSIEEEGSEAVAQLERHVKALLRLVEAVSDKSKILEKENMGLENKLRDYENINTALREKADRSLVQRIIEPIMACKWAGTDANTRMAHGPVPVQPRHGSEMSQLISPPRQYGGMSP